ncbi:sunset domain-containing protein [Gemelliphila palaticanis]
MKGNVNSKIYHMPYQKHYNKISPANTVYFNSEEEAQAAGYRRAKQ